jgi:CRISPR-associated endonuclease/helicase Cas3
VALRYRPDEDSTIISPRDIRPGDVLIVPTEYGGCDAFGWAPGNTEPVIDVADLAARRGSPILRIGPTLERLISSATPEITKALADLRQQAANDQADESPADLSIYKGLLSELRRHLTPTSQDSPRLARALAATLDTLTQPAIKLRATLTPTPDPGTTTPRAGYDLLFAGGAIAFAEDTSAGGSSRTGTATELHRHQQAVRRRVLEFARNLRLDPALTEALGLAAQWHDEGKRDPRFQTMLYGGNRLLAEASDQLLAKSGRDPADRAGFAHARRQAAYPAGLRHEALSARLAAAYLDIDPPSVPAGPATLDTELVVHLIAAHHGRNRPLLPAVTDPDPQQVAVNHDGTPVEESTETNVDWDAPARFHRLNHRYGRHGLALLESILRLADIYCSIRSEEVASNTTGSEPS